MSFFLKDTKLRVRTNEEGPNFATNIGVPQSDRLTPVLFTTYLKVAMKDIRKKELAQEVAYADDVDFLSKDGIDLDIVEKALAFWNLQMNKEKTETPSIDGTNGEWKQSKKLGMLLDSKEEWKSRKNLTMVAMRKMN